MLYDFVETSQTNLVTEQQRNHAIPCFFLPGNICWFVTSSEFPQIFSLALLVFLPYLICDYHTKLQCFFSSLIPHTKSTKSADTKL